VNQLFEYIERLGSQAYNPVTVAIELLIIGVVIYMILRFLEGTPGARLLRGVGLLLLVGFLLVEVLASTFGWARIAVLYRYFVIGVFLTVLVVFQPELRRGLARLGEARWLRRFTANQDEINEIVDPVVASVAHLSKNKIGALIAIEREVGLDPVLESGVRLDARLSSELLNTIFWPGSALHDMGVVIRAYQVVAAGCQFPLSDSQDIDRSLGSRHRAAMGMSVESDAAIIIVSEETGRISLAQGGKLDAGLKPETLEERLIEILRSEAYTPNNGAPGVGVPRRASAEPK
jgi:diadenylate cyclase